MIGIIGGSGFYGFGDNTTDEIIATPYGKVKVEISTIKGKPVLFIPRHGKDHSIIPSKVNYHANIDAASQLEVQYILTTNAVGSIRSDLVPGTFAIPTDIIDRTTGRISSFDQTEHRSNHDTVFDQKIQQKIKNAIHYLGYTYTPDLTLVVTNGPRFETPAEIAAYQIMGADIVGMTSSPEAFLAYQREIPYASLAIISNFAAGLQTSVTDTEVFEIFSQRIDIIKKIFKSIIVNDE